MCRRLGAPEGKGFLAAGRYTVADIAHIGTVLVLSTILGERGAAVHVLRAAFARMHAAAAPCCRRHAAARAAAHAHPSPDSARDHAHSAAPSSKLSALALACTCVLLLAHCRAEAGERPPGRLPPPGLLVPARHGPPRSAARAQGAGICAAIASCPLLPAAYVMASAAGLGRACWSQGVCTPLHEAPPLLAPPCYLAGA